MNPEPDGTGMHPALSATTTAAMTASTSGLGYIDISPSVQDRVERWLLRPIEEASGHDGFVVLSLCFPLLERVIRFRTGIEVGNFSFNSGLVTELELQLGIARQHAHDFWQVFRNGLEHRSMPKLYNSWTYRLAATGTKLTISGNEFVIDPAKFGKWVVGLVRVTPGMWNHAVFPLAGIYRDAPATT